MIDREAEKIIPIVKFDRHKLAIGALRTLQLCKQSPHGFDFATPQVECDVKDERIVLFRMGYKHLAQVLLQLCKIFRFTLRVAEHLYCLIAPG